jgi:hypothetical protein
MLKVVFLKLCIEKCTYGFNADPTPGSQTKTDPDVVPSQALL